MKLYAALIVIFVGACSCELPKTYCKESVCHPSWFCDCRCYDGAKLEPLPNGDVLCRCSK
jgi:hypothetical protein